MTKYSRVIGAALTVTLMLTAFFSTASASPDQDSKPMPIGTRVHVDIPQELVDTLVRRGYAYPDILNAYVLAQHLGSSPEELLIFKPADMGWKEFSSLLQSYKKSLTVMKSVDAVAKGDNLNGIGPMPKALEGVRTKEDVVSRFRASGHLAVQRLKQADLTEEESLVVLLAVAITGHSMDELVAELDAVQDRQQRHKAMGDLMSRLNRLVGIE